MSRLNQINHWNKPTHYKKQIKQKNFFEILVNYFAIPAMHHPSVMLFRARKKHGWFPLRRDPIRGRHLRK